MESGGASSSYQQAADPLITVHVAGLGRTIRIAKSALMYSETLRGQLEYAGEDATEVVIPEVDNTDPTSIFDVLVFMVAAARSAAGLNPFFAYNNQTEDFPVVLDGDVAVLESERDQKWNEYVNRYLVEHDTEEHHDRIARIANAADFLNVETLLNSALNYLAAMMRDKSIDELRAEFGIPDDLTESERREVEESINWAVAQPMPPHHDDSSGAGPSSEANL